MRWLRERAAKMKDEKADNPDSPTKKPLAETIIVIVSVAAIFGLALWYLVQPQPLMVQGEADATRVDIAARVDGRVAERRVHRGENIAAGQILVTIDNPELLAKLQEAQAALGVAAADHKRIEVGTRAEVIAARRAAVASAEASERLAQQTYDRTKQLTARDFASVQKLDEATASLDSRAAANNSRPAFTSRKPSTDYT
jgi:HlyD family secretion protein